MSLFGKSPVIQSGEILKRQADGGENRIKTVFLNADSETKIIGM